jgi:hypothetical protein
MLQQIRARLTCRMHQATIANTGGMDHTLDWADHLRALPGLWPGTLLELTVIPFFVFFVAKDLHKLTRAAGRAFPIQWRGDAARITAIAVSDVGLYIRALAIIVVLVAVMIFLGLTGLAFAVDPRIGQYALFLAIFAGFAELIPNFGPYIGMAPAIIVALTISPRCHHPIRRRVHRGTARPRRPLAAVSPSRWISSSSSAGRDRRGPRRHIAVRSSSRRATSTVIAPRAAGTSGRSSTRRRVVRRWPLGPGEAPSDPA